MLITAALFLSALGIVMFLIGHVYGYFGISALGGIVIAGVGTRIVETGLVRQTDSLRTTVDLGDFPVGFLVMMLGAVMLLHSLNRFRHNT